MRILGVIPARYASTRFPAKPLVDIAGKSMVQRVFEQAKKSSVLDKVVVATDDERIAQHVKSFGGEACITSANHPSGTDRCFETLTQQTEPFDYVINIQGDEPFIEPQQIALLASLLDGQVQLATLAKKINDATSLFNPNIVKVVFNKTGEALYFSRSPVPHVRNLPNDKWTETNIHFKHIGMYAYRADVLGKINRLSVSALEKAESLEQLRWLENGYRIHVAETTLETIGIDTPEDLEKALQWLESK